MVRMRKIVGSSKDLEKKTESAFTNSSKKPVPGLKDDTTLKQGAKGLIIPNAHEEEPLVEAGLELPSEDESFDFSYDDVIEEDIRVYRTACRYVNQIMGDASTIDINTLAELAQSIIKQVRNGDGMLRLAMRPVYIEPFLGAHPVNVAILAALVGEGRYFSEQQQLRAVVASLTHDIGMSRLNQDILQNQRDLLAEEKLEIEQHPNYGAEIILDRLGSGYAWLATAIRQEHERAQGQGYPGGLTLEKIDPAAQLIGLLDVYEAIIHPRRQHDAYCPSKAVKQVIETRNDYFASAMIKALVEAISVYPVETFVLLNTGQIARVTATNRKNPLRPMIEVRTDHNRQPLSEPKPINLQEYPVLSIVKSLEISEVEELAAGAL